MNIQSETASHITKPNTKVPAVLDVIQENESQITNVNKTPE